MRAHGVAFDAVVRDSLDECEGVGDVAWEQALVFQCPEPAFPGPVLSRRSHSRADMPELGVAHDEQFEVSDRNGPTRAPDSRHSNRSFRCAWKRSVEHS